MEEEKKQKPSKLVINIKLLSFLCFLLCSNFLFGQNDIIVKVKYHNNLNEALNFTYSFSDKIDSLIRRLKKSKGNLNCYTLTKIFTNPILYPEHINYADNCYYDVSILNKVDSIVKQKFEKVSLLSLFKSNIESIEMEFIIVQNTTITCNLKSKLWGSSTISYQKCVLISDVSNTNLTEHNNIIKKIKIFVSKIMER